MRNVMKKAWEIARNGQKKFGGKVREYFAIALKMAWAIVKKGMEMVKLIGTAKQVAWAETIRENVMNFIESHFEKGINWFDTKKGPGYAKGKEAAKVQYEKAMNMLAAEEKAAWWIDKFQNYYKKDWQIEEGFMHQFTREDGWKDLRAAVMHGK